MLMEIISTLQNQSTNKVKVANVMDVYNEAEKYNISRTKTEDIIEKLVPQGSILRPSGYETLQIA
jgi:DNA replicative helicase MCM subunit Mcm2 (Cdc46/Mcm family)